MVQQSPTRDTAKLPIWYGVTLNFVAGDPRDFPDHRALPIVAREIERNGQRFGTNYTVHGYVLICCNSQSQFTIVPPLVFSVILT